MQILFDHPRGDFQDALIAQLDRFPMFVLPTGGSGFATRTQRRFDSNHKKLKSRSAY
jgi:hypothetical protein